MYFCETCQCPAMISYKNSFKRDTVVCDKGIGNITLTLKEPDFFEKMLWSYGNNERYIIMKNCGYYRFCSLYCLNQKFSMKKLAKGMCDFDKHDILAQLDYEIEIKRIQKQKNTSKSTSENSPLLKDDMKEENKILQEKLQQFQEKQNEIIRHIQTDEDKLKESIERKKQIEVDKLIETVKERDKRIFNLQCRIIELEGKR